MCAEIPSLGWWRGYEQEVERQGGDTGWIPVASIEDGIPDEEIFDQVAKAAQRCDRNEISRLLTMLASRDR